jgi:hypothetical protein
MTEQLEDIWRHPEKMEAYRNYHRVNNALFLKSQEFAKDSDNRKLGKEVRELMAALTEAQKKILS